MKSILLTSSILILLIAALRPLLRGKISPRVQYALWLVAALRLLVPGNLFTSAYSALALLDRAEEPPQIVQDIGQASIPVMSYEDAYDRAIRENDKISDRYDSLEDWRAIGLSPEEQEMLSTRAQELMRGPTLAELAAKCVRPVWLGGAALMAGWFLLVNAGLRRRLRGAKRLNGVDCPLPVYVSDALPSPCLCGVVRPAIYVTPAALDDPGRLRHVLAHELTHHRHRDHWWALVRCVCLCLYWFDPLVWWAAALSRQDCELACDEGAIRTLGEAERIPYGRTLVGMIAAGRNSLLQTATTMTGGKRKVTERVKLIARRPKTVIAVALALAVIVACAVGCTFTGAPEGEQEVFTADTLQERLLEVPEDLQADVLARTTDQSGAPLLASYWMNRDWIDYDDGTGWLLSVREESYEEVVEHLRWTTSSCWKCIAYSGGTYYAITCDDSTPPPSDDAEAFYSAYEAIGAYALQQVLSTEGVEPFEFDPNSLNLQPLDTLVERLEDIPEELRGEVVVYHPDYENLGVEPPESSAFLATYQLDAPDSGMSNWLVTVCQWDQVYFEEWLYSIETGTYGVFARDSEHYYATMRPTSVEVEEQDYERWGAAQKAIGEFARQQVLDTEGVEPYDAAALREREYLWEGKSYTDVGYWPYKAVNGSTDVVWIYRMVQLADQGEGGVWIPERVQHIDAVYGVDPTPYHIKPTEAQGMIITEYAAWLQAEADAGRADWALDPIEAARRYIAGAGDLDSIPLDSFTYDSAYLEEAAAGVGPTEEQQAIQAVMDAVINADEIFLTLAPGGTSRVYAYEIPSLEEWDETQGYWAYRLSSFATDFRWKKLDERPGMYATNLVIQPDNRSDCIWLWNGLNMVAIRTPDNRIEYYQAVSNSYGDPVGTSVWNPSPYGYLRQWFDAVELSRLRTTSVPDRGQSHEDVVNEWIEGFEGAMAKCAPGSQYACTYTRAQNVQADAHSFMSKEDMDDFAQSRGYSGDDYGKTWFTFSYELVFVPENENARDYMQAGNTADYADYYPAENAPEGAQFWMRVAYMTLIDGNWVCEGTGTGW